MVSSLPATTKFFPLHVRFSRISWQQGTLTILVSDRWSFLRRLVGRWSLMQHICLPIDAFKNLKVFHVSRKNALMWIHEVAYSEVFLQWFTQIILDSHFTNALLFLLFSVITLLLFGSISSRYHAGRECINAPSVRLLKMSSLFSNLRAM